MNSLLILTIVLVVVLVALIIVQQNKLFYDSVIAGSPIANIETSAHVEWFRLPKDLDFHVTE